jgi:hypothetical protein
MLGRSLALPESARVGAFLERCYYLMLGTSLAFPGAVKDGATVGTWMDRMLGRSLALPGRRRANCTDPWARLLGGSPGWDQDRSRGLGFTMAVPFDYTIWSCRLRGLEILLHDSSRVFSVLG